MFVDVTQKNIKDFNAVVTHPLQSYEWGEFRKNTGIKVIRRAFVKQGKIVDGFTLTLHKIPKTHFYIGYLPKGNRPNEETLKELKRIGAENNCVFIQLEPNIIAGSKYDILKTGYNIKPAAHPLFTKYTFVLDISKSEEELAASLHSKTRYNIKVAQKHNVKVYEDNSEESFKNYLKLMQETTNRQQFYAHTPAYHKTLWESLPKNAQENALSYHLLNATYRSEGGTTHTLTSWVVFVFHDFLYYPYGASSRLHRETMASNLMAWEAIKFGKKLNLKRFDMWGALGSEPDHNDPWYGFHRFKEGYGGQLVEFIGSYDLVIKPAVYEIYKIADKARWGFLKFKKRILR